MSTCVVTSQFAQAQHDHKASNPMRGMIKQRYQAQKKPAKFQVLHVFPRHEQYVKDRACPQLRGRDSNQLK